jgi:hypothetical protein
MKITFDTNGELYGPLRDMIYAVIVSTLKESVESCNSFDDHPGDRKYNKKYKAACKIVIEHFGGKDAG